jgi:hypothetical protein
MDREQFFDLLLSSDSSLSYDAIFLADDFSFRRTKFPIFELTSAALDEGFEDQVEPTTNLNPTISQDHTCIEDIKTRRLKAVLFQPQKRVSGQPYDKNQTIVKSSKGTSIMESEQASDTRDQKTYDSSYRTARTPQANFAWPSKEDQYLPRHSYRVDSPFQTSPILTPSAHHEKLQTAEGFSTHSNLGQLPQRLTQ